MFTGLDQINWTALSHAYGAADNIPALLRERASADPTTAAEAEGELFGNIWHQGTVYEATAYAVPFLVELLERRETCDRAGLVLLLANIARGRSFLEAHGDIPYFAQDANEPETKAKLAEELAWRDSARAAVQRHAEAYWKLLNNPAIRVSIPYLLAALPAERERIEGDFPQRIAAADDPLYTASLVLGLALATRGPERSSAYFVPLLERDQPIVRLAGALGVLTGASAQPFTDRAVAIYFEAFGEDPRFKPEDSGWLWGEGNPGMLFLNCLPSLHPTALDSLREALPVELPKLDLYWAIEVATETMLLGFDPDHLPRSKAELTALQRALLTAHARQTGIQLGDPLVVRIQAALGLPRDMMVLQKFLEEP